jgi:signal peptidase I
MSELPPPSAPEWAYRPAPPEQPEIPRPPAEAPPSPQHTDGDGKKRVGGLRNAVEWVVIIAVALIGAFLIRAFVVQTFYIPSESMVPTLQKQDRVLVNKLSYRMHAIHRGDIVVFEHSPGFDPTIKDLIKRVVALPGETVQGKDGHVFIDGHELNEPYLRPGVLTTDFGPRLIPPDRYWVMGDNRTNSSDSRVFGPIAKSQVVGRAFVLIWPLSRIGQL